MEADVSKVEGSKFHWDSAKGYLLGCCFHIAVITGFFLVNGYYPKAYVVGGMLGRLVGSIFWAWIIWLIARAFGKKKEAADRDSFIYGLGLILLALITLADILRYLRLFDSFE